MARANDDRVVDLALLHAAAWRGFLHRDLDDVANVRVPALAAAEHLDAHHGARARVVGDVEYRLHLNHDFVLSNLIRLRRRLECNPRTGSNEKAAARFGPRL